MSKCATEPCPSCPYRKDTPKGLWALDHYKLLPRYDGSIMEQVANGGLNVFGCHYNNGNLCRGWIDCHGAGNLLALKLADCITPEMFTEPKAEVYESGAAVLAANLPHMDNPAPDALAMVEMLKRIPGKILLDGTPAS